MRLLLLAAAAAALSGCIVVSDVDVPGDGFDTGDREERLYGASVEPGGVRIRVASNGCTTEESFDIDVDRFQSNGEPRYLVRFERDTPDRCRAFVPDGVELFFSRDRLGLSSDALISIANRIGG